jgi:hypothetical protein
MAKNVSLYRQNVLNLSPGPNVIKLFVCNLRAIVFVPGKRFLPNLTNALA